MESNRLPRFKRSLTVSPIRLTERDREVIRQVHRHRFLDSAQIVALTDGSSQSVIRRLQLLYHHGFLERPRAQLDYYHRGGSRRIVYGLGNKSGAIINRNSSMRHSRPREGEKSRSVGRIFLEHALLVSDILVAIEVACRRSGSVRFIPEEQLVSSTGERQSFRWNVNITNSVKLGVVPDRVFALEFQNSNDAETRANFFLEADRGTMPVTRKDLSQTSLCRKFLAYEATWAQSIHQKRLGFQRFRVLTVTTSPERVTSLLTVCSNLKRGRGIFLFADKSLLLKPRDILLYRWQTAKPEETATLLI